MFFQRIFIERVQWWSSYQWLAVRRRYMRWRLQQVIRKHYCARYGHTAETCYSFGNCQLGMWRRCKWCGIPVTEPESVK